MRNNLSEILEMVAWSDSYLLGWSIGPEEIRLFLQVKVLEGHPDFRGFDEKREYGDYHLAVLSVPGAACDGLSTSLETPKWNPELQEFRDVAEIDQLQYQDGVLKVLADELEFALTGDAVLDIMNTNSADSFRRFLAGG